MLHQVKTNDTEAWIEQTKTNIRTRDIRIIYNCFQAQTYWFAAIRFSKRYLRHFFSCVRALPDWLKTFWQPLHEYGLSPEKWTLPLGIESIFINNVRTQLPVWIRLCLVRLSRVLNCFEQLRQSNVPWLCTFRICFWNAEWDQLKTGNHTYAPTFHTNHKTSSCWQSFTTLRAEVTRNRIRFYA